MMFLHSKVYLLLVLFRHVHGATISQLRRVMYVVDIFEVIPQVHSESRVHGFVTIVTNGHSASWVLGKEFPNIAFNKDPWLLLINFCWCSKWALNLSWCSKWALNLSWCSKWALNLCSLSHLADLVIFDCKNKERSD